MAVFIKYDGITNQAPQNFNRTVAPRREEEASRASQRDVVDTFSRSKMLDKASPGVADRALDNVSPKARGWFDIQG